MGPRNLRLGDETPETFSHPNLINGVTVTSALATQNQTSTVLRCGSTADERTLEEAVLCSVFRGLGLYYHCITPVWLHRTEEKVELANKYHLGQWRPPCMSMCRRVVSILVL